MWHTVSTSFNWRLVIDTIILQFHSSDDQCVAVFVFLWLYSYYIDVPSRLRTESQSSDSGFGRNPSGTVQREDGNLLRSGQRTSGWRRREFGRMQAKVSALISL